jgi:hypothetical protein
VLDKSGTGQTWKLDLLHPNGEGHDVPDVIAPLRSHADANRRGALPQMPSPPDGMYRPPTRGPSAGFVRDQAA